MAPAIANPVELARNLRRVQGGSGVAAVAISLQSRGACESFCDFVFRIMAIVPPFAPEECGGILARRGNR